MAVKFTQKLIPEAFKKILKKTGKNHDENLLKLLVIEKLDGKNVIKIDFPFSVNGMMFDDVESAIKAGSGAAYDNLIQRLGSMHFGDNVGHYDKHYKLDSGEGGWNIVITNPTLDGHWVSCVTYLIPDGFDISE